MVDIWKVAKHFKPSEFGCPCGCVKAPNDIDPCLLWILEAIRTKYNKPVVISKGGGYRCPTYNARTKGSITNSKHTFKKAADFYIDGICDTLKGRKEIMEYMKTLPNFDYAYCDENGNHKNMGKAIHVQVK